MINNTSFPTLDNLLSSKDKSVFEPTVPPILKKSVFFVNTVGMREAPERLILELFREVAYENMHPGGDSGARDLKPDPTLSPEEQALLYIDRGRARRKNRKVIESPPYYGPLYPELARNAWPRKQAESVIKHQLIVGPLAQYVRDAKEDSMVYAAEIVHALFGKKRCGQSGNDIFKDILGRVGINNAEVGLREETDAIDELGNTLGQAAKRSTLDSDRSDLLAERIAKDFYNLCHFEGHIPRLLWIELLKSFLRIAMPAWLLAHMRLTVYLRDWTLAAIGGKVPDNQEMLESIRGRWRGIFHPTHTGSNEVPLHIERYMKARIELSLLVYLVKYASGDQAIDGELTVCRDGSDQVSLAEWMLRSRTAGLSLGLEGADQDTVRGKIIPFAQNFGAWLNPASKGQGKNIEEFLRIFLRISVSDEDHGYLLDGSKYGFKGAVVFPGPAILKTMLYLTALDKTAIRAQARGKLVLSDLERHFARYGVDFDSSVGARPKLISELSRIGFLKGSPDAGDSAELITPDKVESMNLGS